MDENTLLQLWHNFIIHPPKDDVEKRTCLIKLLDVCIWHFTRHSNSKANSSLINDSKNTTLWVGNWLIQQFMIDIGSASLTHSDSKGEYKFLNDYFTEGIGWKLLKSIYYFNANEPLLYNVQNNSRLIQILVLILKQYINFITNDLAPEDLVTFTQQEFKFTSLEDQRKFSEQTHLKFLNNGILSPAKVKAWIKSSCNSSFKANKKSYNEDNSDGDSDKDSSYPPKRSKHGVNNTRLFYSQSKIEQVDLSTKLTQLHSQIDQNDLTTKKPFKSEIIHTIVEILVDFIRSENRLEYQKSNSNGDIGINKLAALIIEEFSPIMTRFVDSIQDSLEVKLSLLRPIKQLVIASAFIVSQTSLGVQLIAKHQIMPNFLKLLERIDLHLKGKNSNQFDKANYIQLRTEFCDLLSSSIKVLIEISKYLIQTKQFTTFAELMRIFFSSSHLELLHSLFYICEKQNETISSEYHFLYTIVDQLLQLQITLQYSQSFTVHKQLCAKRRHKKCDLTPLMVHHLYHERIFGPSTDCSEEYSCFISSIYHVLINLIFICSAHPSEKTEKLICFICGHLTSLISCCWSLKPHFNRLLHFAVCAERSNAIRSSIFNIIEFNIRNQRKYLFNSAHVVEKCNFCPHEEIFENGVEMRNGSKNSENSEGYLTDNANSSGALKCKLGMGPGLEHCLDSNCLIASLSTHYISLLKSESSSIRQTIFRHLLNLFSYLNNNSKISLLYHIIFPVIQNASEFPLDVCAFTLRLLIYIASRSGPQSDDLNLQSFFKKVDHDFCILKQLIVYGHSAQTSLRYIVSNEDDQYDLSLLGIRLLESFIKNELLYLQATLKASAALELPSNVDLQSLNAISLLVNLFMEQFHLFKRRFILPSANGSLTISDSSLEGYIEFYQKACFDFAQMEDHDLQQLTCNLKCLLKMLNTTNIILTSHKMMRSVLIHETYHFSEKFYLFFQQMLQLMLNEVKLFRLLFFRSQNNPDQKTHFDLNKYSTFLNKVMRIIEQMLLLLLQIEPFSFKEQTYTIDDICSVINVKLKSFTSDTNIFKWSAACTIDPILDLLKTFVNIAFDSNQVVKCYLKCDFDDLMDLGSYLLNHPRSSSLDSVISDSEIAEETIEMDDYDTGYHADTEPAAESFLNSRLTTSQKELKQTESNENRFQQRPSTQSASVLKYVDICKTVIQYLSQSLAKNSVLSIQDQNSAHVKAELSCSLSIINTLTRYCKENAENCLILFENDFTTLLMTSFRHLLISSSAEDKPIKYAIFDLFIEICKVKLHCKELKLLIDFYKQENADFDFLLSITHRILFSKHTDLNQPLTNVLYPVTSSFPKPNQPELWLDTIIANIRTNSEINENDQTCLKLFACALPFTSTQIVNFQYSLTFWIYLDKISPLIDKFKSSSSLFENSHSSKSESPKLLANENKTKIMKCVHIISMVFNSSTIELWFDYIYNRFFYRICKENNGKLIYSSENFISNLGNILGRWNFIRVNVEQLSIPKSRNSFVKISHSTNCSKEDTVKLSYPVNLLDKKIQNSAILVGSTQTNCHFQYRLGNIMLFNQHLQPSSTVFLYSLGPDFAHLHHLKSECITKENYISLPKQWAKDSSMDLVSTMFQHISPLLESKSILKHIIVMYRESHPNVYFTHQVNSNKSSLPFSRFYPQSSRSKKKQVTSIDEMKEHSVKMYGLIQSYTQFGVSKIISDSGGVSLFLFMLCYLFERCESPTVHYKALELLLRVYESHYQHRLLFDTHYSGQQIILFVLEKSQKVFQSNFLRVFSQFSTDSVSGHSLILSSAIATFLQSWRVWCRNRTTMKLFFAKLESLVSSSNPFRNYNLAQLRRVNAFSRLLHMIKDMYINYNDGGSTSIEIQLDAESVDHVIAIFKSIIDSNTDLQLFKSVFNCILILQRTEWLHVNQTRTSFYYLFPSSWLSNKDNFSQETINRSTEEEVESFEANLNLDDWEIVSEMLDNSAQVDSLNEPFNPSFLGTLNCDLVVNQMLLLVNRFVDQLSDITLMDVIFEQELCLDFLLVFVNTPSDRVREIALQTYFKFFNLFYKKDRSPIHTLTDDSNNKVTIKRKTLDLLLLANQLYRFMATEETVLSCLSFLLDLNRKSLLDVFNQASNSVLTRSLYSISLDRFIPFLALLPKCVSSLSFCHKTLQMLHRILRALSIEQLSQLQQNFGLAQSISKLMINLNTQLVLTADDLNKYSKEYLNETLFKILYEIAHDYLMRSGLYYFSCFTNLLHYLAIMERKVTAEVSPVFRQAQVGLLQSALDCLVQQKNGYNHRSQKSGNLDVLSEQFTHILSTSDFVHSDFSNDFSTAQEVNADRQNDRESLKPKEIVDRLIFVIKKAFNFIVCRDDIRLTQKEIFFQREFLFHLFAIVDQAGGIISRDPKQKKNIWSNLPQSSKDLLKVHLTQIVLFLISPFQSMSDRVFSLNLFVEKTRTFQYIKSFIDRSNESRFAHLFEAFVVDLIEKGIKDLAITNLRSYMDDFDGLLKESFSDNSNSQESLSLEYVLEKYKNQMNLKGDKSESFYKAEIANWYDQIEGQKIEYELSIRKHVNKIFSNMLLVFNQVSESATVLNDKIILAQHHEKKDYIEHIRKESFANQSVRSHICKLINESVHERAFWHMPQYFPQSWALSPFESKNRIRRKLERSFLEIDSRYLLQPYSKLLSGDNLLFSLLGSNSNCFMDIPAKDAFSLESTEANPLLYTTSVRVILFDEEIEGEILLKSELIQFFANNEPTKKNLLTFSSKRTFFQNFVIHYNEIQELTSCRYELQNNALEIYLNSGLTYLIAFESTAIRDEFMKHLTSNQEMLPNLVEKINLVTLTQLWRERRISNFEYLIHLNKLSGRTSNDLMQYQVFPFVLADYESDVINLKDITSFRIFSRPIAVQKKEREKHYVDQYNYIKSENERNLRSGQDVNSFQFVVTSAPYHYGSHYSNSGIVLHYLVRLPPYTQMFLQYQDKNFDIPDRTFHSIYTTWRLATEDSTNGFKELIPEFFYLPEFLMNNENFNLGVRQNGERVDNVILPPWARNCARFFVLVHRQALESNYVTQHLNHWIDLIFGYQQSGKAAIEAINVFHPATHFSADLSKIEDEVKRHAIQTMIKTFGQMPNQLFNMPHPSISSDATLPFEDDQMVKVPEVIGLKWGHYVGSPLFPPPLCCFSKKFPDSISRVWALPTNDLLLLPQNSCLLVTYNQQRNIFINTLYIISYNICIWSTLDSSIWITNKEDGVLFTDENQLLDKISLCASIPDYNYLLVGYESGLIVAFYLNSVKIANSVIKFNSRYSMMVGHRSQVTAISINKDLSAALSGDVSGLCILWDMSKLQYVRTILMSDSKCSPVKLTCISETLGDLAIVRYSYDGDRITSSTLNVCTINGLPVGKVKTPEHDAYITSLCYSTCMEGLSINVIATGFSNGIIKLWSSWDLTLIRQFELPDRMTTPIKSISFSFTNDLLYIVSEDNHLMAFENNIPTHFAAQLIPTTSYLKGHNFRLIDLSYLKTRTTL